MDASLGSRITSEHLVDIDYDEQTGRLNVTGRRGDEGPRSSQEYTRECDMRLVLTDIGLPGWQPSAFSPKPPASTQ